VLQRIDRLFMLRLLRFRPFEPLPGEVQAYILELEPGSFDLSMHTLASRSFSENLLLQLPVLFLCPDDCRDVRDMLRCRPPLCLLVCLVRSEEVIVCRPEDGDLVVEVLVLVQACLLLLQFPEILLGLIQ